MTSNQELLTKVDIYIRVLQQEPSNTGLAMIMYCSKGKAKKCYFSTLGASKHKSIFIACITALQGLKRRCNIKMLVQSNFGFERLLNDEEWVDRVWGDKLQEAITACGHVVQFFDCSDGDTVPTGEIMQMKLDGMMKKTLMEGE